MRPSGTPLICAFLALLAGPVLAETLDLSGSWTMTERYRSSRGKWLRPSKPRRVRVPGFFHPGRDLGFDRVELTFSRRFAVPAGWRRALRDGKRLLAEFDSVDYFTEVRIAQEGRPESRLGEHRGYIGRFALPVEPFKGDASLKVIVRDVLHDEEVFEDTSALESWTVQGGDDKKGGNRVGIVERCRLRMVGPVYLRNAFLAVLSPGPKARLRLGAELVPTSDEDRKVELRWSVRSPIDGKVLAQGRVAHEVSASRSNEPVVLLRDIDVRGLPTGGGAQPPVLTARIEVWSGERPSDSREHRFIHRRVDTAGNRFRINGRPAFLKGAVVHAGLRLLPFGELPKKAAYAANDESFRQRLRDAARSAREANVRLLRPAHLLPVRGFHRAMDETGLLVYQDFPLMFNYDFKRLSPDEIFRQFEEFLWRVAAEPSVALIALHNEAEIRDQDPADRRIVHKLLRRMLRRARKLTPHLTLVGNSGGAGTAAFPPDPKLPLKDDVLDRHAYLGHRWQPQFGYRELREAVQGQLSVSDGRPVLWSELSGGWPEHFLALLRLDDSLARTRPKLDFKVGPRKLSPREFYAVVDCFRRQGIRPPGLADCAKKLARRGNDPLLIRRAKEHFLADRPLGLGLDGPATPRHALALACDWLATQLYEARAAYHAGRSMAGTTPWEWSRMGGFPVYPPDVGLKTKLPPHLTRGCRQTVAAAYAPAALFARQPDETGRIELVFLNERRARKAELAFKTANGPPAYEKITLPAGGMTSFWLTPGTELWEKLQGRRVSAELRFGKRMASRYSFYCPGRGDKRGATPRAPRTP